VEPIHLSIEDANVKVTPELLAALFWEADCEQQADFFAELEKIAGTKLCYQMAAVVREIQQRNDAGDHGAQRGFQTMLAHAQNFVESAIDIRVWDAQREIDRRAASAKMKIGSIAP
jgi:hypothetical protein